MQLCQQSSSCAIQSQRIWPDISDNILIIWCVSGGLEMSDSSDIRFNGAQYSEGLLYIQGSGQGLKPLMGHSRYTTLYQSSQYDHQGPSGVLVSLGCPATTLLHTHHPVHFSFPTPWQFRGRAPLPFYLIEHNL